MAGNKHTINLLSCVHSHLSSAFVPVFAHLLGLVWLPSFGARNLESRNSFMILEITCLPTTELVTEFISNSMVFIPWLILIPMWHPVIYVALPDKMISSYHFILFVPNEMK
jgi:hypothetical protein